MNMTALVTEGGGGLGVGVGGVEWEHGMRGRGKAVLPLYRKVRQAEHRKL